MNSKQNRHFNLKTKIMKKITSKILKKRWLKKNVILGILIFFSLGVMAQLPDLVILDPYWKNLNGPDDYIERGDTIVFYFWGKNIGNDSTPSGVTLGAQFRVTELDHGWTLYEQAGWVAIKNTYLPVGDSMLFESNSGGALNNGKWIAGAPGNYQVFYWFDDSGAEPCKRICEEDEENNKVRLNFKIHPNATMPGKLPDLVVTDFQFVDTNGDPVIPANNDDVLFKATVKNIGADTAFSDGNKIEVSFYNLAISNDNLIASTSANELFDSLPPGESITVMGNLSEGNNNGTISGSWQAYAGDTIIFCQVDADSVVNESSETNNIISKVLYVDVPAENQMPDLIITDMLFDPPYPITGDAVSLSVVIKNIGPVGIPSGSNISAVWTNADGDPISITVGSNLGVDTIPPGESDTLTGNFEGDNGRWIAPGPGTYLIKASIDFGNTVNEAIEANNEFNRTLIVNWVSDLAITDISWTNAPDTLEAHVKTKFTATIENTFGSPTVLNDILIVKWEIAGFGVVGHDTLSLDQSLDVGESVSLTMDEYWLPFSGLKQVTATLDKTNIHDSFLDNNKAMDSIWIKKYTGPLPDLIVTDIRTIPENPRENDTIILVAVVKNVGDTTTIAQPGQGLWGHYFVDGVEIGRTDKNIYKEPISANEEINLVMDNIYANKTFIGTEGDHTLKVEIDRKLYIEESDETNNITEVIVSVGPPRLPDLTPSGLTWTPADPVTDDVMSMQVYIKNDGELDITDSDTILVKWIAGDAVLDSVIFAGNIGIGDSVQVTGAKTWTAIAGEYIIIAVIDANNTVEESDENNNDASAGLTVLETGIRKIQDERLSIYPNPVQSILHINYISDEMKSVSVKISNILGEILLAREEQALQGINSFDFNVEALPQGIYVIQAGSRTLTFIVR